MKKVVVQGWKPAKSAPARSRTYTPDFVSTSARVLQKTKVAPDAAPAPARKTQLRAVYLKPAKGTDAQAKVFLVDAAELQGLWRVLSFLLMGLAFLGISWAYARFVFGIGVKKLKDTPPSSPG